MYKEAASAVLPGLLTSNAASVASKHRFTRLPIRTPQMKDEGMTDRLAIRQEPEKFESLALRVVEHAEHEMLVSLGCFQSLSR